MDINGCSRSETISLTTKIVLARVASGLVAVDGEYFRLPVVGGWGVFLNALPRMLHLIRSGKFLCQEMVIPSTQMSGTG